MALAFILVGCPIALAVDAWRFSPGAWEIAGFRPLVWKVLPVALVGGAFLPFGVWWFRSLVLAADLLCIPYVNVRPMLLLSSVLGTDAQSDVVPRASASSMRIEGRPALASRKRSMLSWLNPYGETFGGSGRNSPRVVVNGRGEEHVLFVKPTWEEVLVARERVNDDLLRMGIDRWKQLYGVPTDFLN